MVFQVQGLAFGDVLQKWRPLTKSGKPLHGKANATIVIYPKHLQEQYQSIQLAIAHKSFHPFKSSSNQELSLHWSSQPNKNIPCTVVSRGSTYPAHPRWWMQSGSRCLARALVTKIQDTRYTGMAIIVIYIYMYMYYHICSALLKTYCRFCCSQPTKNFPTSLSETVI